MTASERPILLVEDNPHDEELTVRALRKAQVTNPIAVARDGAEALDYLLGRGTHAASPPPLPQVVLLDLKTPKMIVTRCCERCAPPIGRACCPS